MANSQMQMTMNTQSIYLNSFLLRGILEGFIDGILIITAQGELVHSNKRAQEICQQLERVDSQTRLAPEEIWQVCQAVLDSNQTYGDRQVIIESEIKLEYCDSQSSFRVRARWLELDDFQPCILVTLEDQTQSFQNMVFTEVAQYSLTSREQDVWSLRRAEYTYKEIASELCITINTVKKHLKNIRAKIESTQLRQPVGAAQGMLMSSVS